MAKIKNPTTIFGVDGTEEPITISDNGIYYSDPGVKYNPITVDIPETKTDEPITLRENDVYIVPSGVRYNPITVDVPQEAVVDEYKEINSNGLYVPEFGKRFNPLRVAVPTVRDVPVALVENGEFTPEDGLRYNPISVMVPQFDVEDEPKTITENGEYSPYEGKRFNPLTVNVPVPEDESLEVTENGIYEPEEGTRFNYVEVNVPQTSIVDEPITFRENGHYAPDEGKRYNPITVAVPLPTTMRVILNSNGVYDVPDNLRYDPIQVTIPLEDNKNINITENGNYSLEPSDRFVAIESGTINVSVPQTTDTPFSITENGEYTPPPGTRYNPITVSISGSDVDEEYTFTENGYYEPPANVRYSPITVNVHESTGEKMKNMLLLWLDGIKNAGADAEHSASATTWADLSAYHHVSTISNGAWGTDHLSFNGTSTRVLCQSAVSFQNLNPPVFTLEIAAKFNSLSQQTLIDSSPAQEGNDNENVICIRNNTLMDLHYCLYGAEHDSVQVNFMDSPPIDEKAVWTLVSDGHYLATYYNGLILYRKEVAFLVNTVRNLTIGASNGDGYFYDFFNGDIYSIRMWSAGFSTDIVSSLATETMERFNIGGTT